MGKFVIIFICAFSFWVGRNSVSNSVKNLLKEVSQKNDEITQLNQEITKLENDKEKEGKILKEKELALQVKHAQIEQEKSSRSPATAPAGSVSTSGVQVAALKEESPVDDTNAKEKQIQKEQAMRSHLEKVMQYVEYLNESDSGRIIEFLQKQRAPDKDEYKGYNKEIDQTIGQVQVRCETYMNDCFGNQAQEWESEREEVVYCATQFSRCLKSDDYQELNHNEKNDLIHSI